MKMRNKGKVHPFTSSSSSSSSSNNNKDSFSSLTLLPAAILALVSVLSLDDREVLAYMINTSLNSTSPPSLPLHNTTKNNSKTKQQPQCHHSSPALFHCHCFHCYTSFWSRWDASLNRDLIGSAIDAFEDHLATTERRFKTVPGKTRKREKMGRRKIDKPAPDGGVLEPPPPENQESIVLEIGFPAEEGVEGLPENDVAAAPAAVVRSHKGLARKVLPDVMGIFSSRLWSLWSPNV